MNQAEADGLTPLFLAALNDHVAMAELLLGRGAVVNQAKADGVTPLLIAAQNGHVMMAELLLGRGAAVNQAMNNDATPLMVAQEQGHVCFTALLDASLTARAAARAGHVALFREAAEAGAFPAPLAQWGPALSPAARAELLSWAAARVTDERLGFAALHEGEAAEGPLQGLRDCDDLRRTLMGYLVAQRPAARLRAREMLASLDLVGAEAE